MDELKTSDQRKIVACVGEPDYFDLVVKRGRRSFTERDPRVLNVVRHHVAEAFRTATASLSPPVLPLLEALESGRGRKPYCLRFDATVQFSSRLAQQHLETFVSKERPFHGGLPLTVR